MSRIQVAVEFNFPKLDDESAKELARQIVETRGFEVAVARVVKTPGEGKAFTPRAGKPGSRVVRQGRTFEVWSEAPNRELWVVPVERQADDAAVYLTRADPDAGVSPYHGDGAACRSTWTTNADFIRTEVPCQHRSHQAAS